MTGYALALKRQKEQIKLMNDLKKLAEKHGFKVNSIKIKPDIQRKSREV